MSRWANGGWNGDGRRRESFFFPGGEGQLFGSLYAAEPRSSPFDVVLCNSLGFEGNLGENLMHGLAVSTMEAGGAAVAFHHPGFGDSGGDHAAVTMESLVTAAAGAVAEAERRAGGPAGVILAGFALGASVACLAAQRCDAVRRLLLVQPELLPSSYLDRLERMARRRAALGPVEGIVYGYALPRRMIDSAAADDAAVAAALGAFEGDVAVVRYEAPQLDDPPVEPAEEVLVEGTWRFGTRDTSKLQKATAKWLRRQARR